ncbi:hypothetical protein AMS68_003492 [Peltaster fructicola]|uniref:Protein kinase domain-containing protein n=1 Tax=Peltaster fructicola TaxID=286661 RepID=A0A6H0XTK8_9PEZI|nr:hypothetical protein AMS68_003492 [Peltaster fructicola]
MAAVQHQPRPHYPRPSPFSSSYRRVGLNTAASATKHVNVSDSDSDDDPPPAIKFSKVTEALLNDRPVPSSPIRQDNHDLQRHLRATSAQPTLDTPSRVSGLRILRKSSPSALGSAELGRGSTPPRIVHLGGTQQGSARRTISIAGPYPQLRTKATMTPQAAAHLEIVTPAQRSRDFGARARSGSNASQDGQHRLVSSSRPGSSDGPKETARVEQRDLAASLSRGVGPAESRYAPSTIGKTRNFTTDQPPPASQRVKRAPILTGTFLKSGPMRRGTRRRESEENVSPTDEDPHGAQSQPSSSYTPQASSSRSRSNSINTRATSVEPISVHDFAREKPSAQASRPDSRQAQASFSRSQAGSDYRPPSRQASHEQVRSRQSSVERHQPERYRFTSSIHAPSSVEPKQRSSVEIQPKATLDQKLPHRVPSINRPYRYVASREAIDEQENAPPPTFRRNKDQEFKYLGRTAGSIMSDDEKPKQTPLQSVPLQERKVLGAMSNNTPHRPAPPPPPKMSVLETATTAAGAAATKSRKKRVHVVINGKIYTQMGKIGKGGSSDVYCVMAENYKTFAMKKVKLEDCDENAVRGYKGEIDLLNKLTEVERVVRLYDWELNDDKQELMVLMEKGDTDLNRVLTMKINGQESKFDAAFTRYHWKEMLECVQAVHEHEIVHSDLKPANFLVVQGRLKLIDFGIANAIDIDNTCNVHRDSHVGTPNYMSPESITDTNASGPGFSSNKDAEGRPLKKDMRIGKSSDVWSLGCILYQMTYGRPPFAHIANQISRIMAITNPKHIIDFPDTGIGGCRVPSSLKGVLKRCLQREADLRPTIPQLLSDSDDFLNPEADGAVMIRQEVLDQIINKVVDRCRDTRRGMPTASEVAQYAPSFMVKIKEMAEKV